MRLVVSLAFLTLALVAVACSPEAQAQRGGNDYCSFGQHSTLFLIDRTTAYDANDERILMRSASTVVQELGIGDRIVVATIAGHYSSSEVVFNECNPGCPPSRDDCRPVAARRDRLMFQQRLVTALRPLTRNTGSADNSDITGTLSQLTRRPPARRAFTNVLLYSDMLENSQALPWSSFRSQTPEQSMSVIQQFNLGSSVEGAEVLIVGFGRSHDPGRPPLSADMDLRVRTFWQNYFAAGGASQVHFELR